MGTSFFPVNTVFLRKMFHVLVQVSFIFAVFAVFYCFTIITVLLFTLFYTVLYCFILFYTVFTVLTVLVIIVHFDYTPGETLCKALFFHFYRFHFIDWSRGF